MITEDLLREYLYFTDDQIEIDGDIVNVTGDVGLIKSCGELPFQFGEVTGEVGFHEKELTTLRGSPTKVGGAFYAYGNDLTDLKGGPKIVEGIYSVFRNPLTSLEGSPEILKGRFYLSWSVNVPLLRLVKYNKVELRSALYATDAKTCNSIIASFAGKTPVRQAIIQCQKELIDAGFSSNAIL